MSKLSDEQLNDLSEFVKEFDEIKLPSVIVIEIIDRLRDAERKAGELRAQIAELNAQLSASRQVNVTQATLIKGLQAELSQWKTFAEAAAQDDKDWHTLTDSNNDLIAALGQAIIKLGEKLEASESRLHEVAVACANAEYKLARRAEYYRNILAQISDYTLALRAGGPATEDLQELSDALETVTGMAHDAYVDTAAPPAPAVPDETPELKKIIEYIDKIFIDNNNNRPVSMDAWLWNGLVNVSNMAQNACRAAMPAKQGPTSEYGDVYRGAREDLAIWKRRALEAEAASRVPAGANAVIRSVSMESLENYASGWFKNEHIATGDVQTMAEYFVKLSRANGDKGAK